MGFDRGQAVENEKQGASAGRDVGRLIRAEAVGDTPPLAVFDATHGQSNWTQTGFASREMQANFVGVMESLCRQGCLCRATGDQPLSKYLDRARLLVIPPPTGHYNPHKECWTRQTASLFTVEEIAHIHGFLDDGGRLFLSAYRFGDAFTATNLQELVGPLGCLLNEDVVIDVRTLRTSHPLEAHFDTPRCCLPLPWSLDWVSTVRWRAMATFTILPGATASPLALSPGGNCISFNRAHREINFASLPIAVAGSHGKGRFVLLGGPHAFEIGPFGLLTIADNARFLHNALSWLLADGPTDPAPSRLPQCSVDMVSDLGRVENEGKRQSTVAFLERLLRSTGVLKALSQAKWLP